MIGKGAEGTSREADMPRYLSVALQPLLITLVLVTWWLDPKSIGHYLGALLLVQVVLGLLERRYALRPRWLLPAATVAKHVALVTVLVLALGFVGEFYSQTLAAPLSELRVRLGLDIWPHDWPVLAQIFLVFFLSEFLWYWLHRAEHRWSVVWRVSGHGAHHAFKKLSALNFGLNHPFELFFIALPAALIELFFGVGIAAAGAALLGATQASIAHANLGLNTRYVGLLFTTNRYHLLHHSSDLAESNTNFGCAAIVWDRVFGTFSDRVVEDVGTGPTEPTIGQKLLMPFREPADTNVSPGTDRVAS